MSRRRRRTRSAKKSSPATRLIVLLALVATVAGAYFWRDIFHTKRPAKATVPPRVQLAKRPHPRKDSEELSAKIYFLGVVEGQQRLVPIACQVPSGHPARSALESLLYGKLPKGLERPLPPGVQLLGVKARNGVVSANFSKDLIRNFQGGSDNEGVAVYAVVNTLTSLPGIRQAQILVEGRPVDSIGGHLDVSLPLGFDGELVVSQSLRAAEGGDSH